MDELVLVDWCVFCGHVHADDFDCDEKVLVTFDE